MTDEDRARRVLSDAVSGQQWDVVSGEAAWGRGRQRVHRQRATAGVVVCLVGIVVGAVALRPGHRRASVPLGPTPSPVQESAQAAVDDRGLREITYLPQGDWQNQSGEIGPAGESVNLELERPTSAAFLDVQITHDSTTAPPVGTQLDSDTWVTHAGTPLVVERRVGGFRMVSTTHNGTVAPADVADALTGVTWVPDSTTDTQQPPGYASASYLPPGVHDAFATPHLNGIWWHTYGVGTAHSTVVQQPAGSVILLQTQPGGTLPSRLAGDTDVTVGSAHGFVRQQSGARSVHWVNAGVAYVLSETSDPASELTVSADDLVHMARSVRPPGTAILAPKSCGANDQRRPSSAELAALRLAVVPPGYTVTSIFSTSGAAVGARYCAWTWLLNDGDKQLTLIAHEPRQPVFAAADSAGKYDGYPVWATPTVQGEPAVVTDQGAQEGVHALIGRFQVDAVAAGGADRLDAIAAIDGLRGLGS